MSCDNGSQCPQPINCCPVKCPIDQVICINCCVPISATCNAPATQTLFSNINPCERIDGYITITNDSCPPSVGVVGCQLSIGIQERGRFRIEGLTPSDRVGLTVNDLISITITSSGLTTGEIVTGKANMQLRKTVQLDC